MTLASEQSVQAVAAEVLTTLLSSGWFLFLLLGPDQSSIFSFSTSVFLFFFSFAFSVAVSSSLTSRLGVLIVSSSELSSFTSKVCSDPFSSSLFKSKVSSDPFSFFILSGISLNSASDVIFHESRIFLAFFLTATISSSKQGVIYVHQLDDFSGRSLYSTMLNFFSPSSLVCL